MVVAKQARPEPKMDAAAAWPRLRSSRSFEALGRILDATAGYSMNERACIAICEERRCAPDCPRMRKHALSSVRTPCTAVREDLATTNNKQPAIQ